ncbi:hypothetical protein DL96DRAFT_1582184 [Flagelloscypha sp. PMI_526]|nr:hypothetical protein DL96DRAFT_1582184 [Flagelloscypha sp. PMI_526]
MLATSNDNDDDGASSVTLSTTRDYGSNKHLTSSLPFELIHRVVSIVVGDELHETFCTHDRIEDLTIRSMTVDYWKTINALAATSKVLRYLVVRFIRTAFDISDESLDLNMQVSFFTCPTFLSLANDYYLTRLQRKAHSITRSLVLFQLSLDGGCNWSQPPVPMDQPFIRAYAWMYMASRASRLEGDVLHFIMEARSLCRNLSTDLTWAFDETLAEIYESV